jgi:hypothetical protein
LASARLRVSRRAVPNRSGSNSTTGGLDHSRSEAEGAESITRTGSGLPVSPQPPSRRCRVNVAAAALEERRRGASKSAPHEKRAEIPKIPARSDVMFYFPDVDCCGAGSTLNVSPVNIISSNV